MMITCLDIETTYQKDDAFSYNGKNQLVSVGFKTHTGKEDYLWFYHKEREPTNNAKQILQDLLYNTKILIGHNIKFDLGWLYCCGFTYNNAVYDTMVVEYLLSRGVHRPISLDESCKRRKVKQKKKHLIEDYMNSGVNMDDIPHKLVEEYGRGDVICTYDLAMKQMEVLEMDINEFSKHN
jgi:DNA polymerase I-like protein with 3'-5' exonuclease and polymerase domains